MQSMLVNHRCQRSLAILPDLKPWTRRDDSIIYTAKYKFYKVYKILPGYVRKLGRAGSLV